MIQNLKSSPLIFSIEGNIGAGKTTFLKIMKDSIDLSLEVIEEPISEWNNLKGNASDSSNNLLDLFYKDPARWSYAFQNYCFFTRLRSWHKIKENLKSEVCLFERSVYSDKNIFAKNMFENGEISEIEWCSYNNWFSFLTSHLQMVFNGIIYLRATPQTCLERIKKRGRVEEENISLDYLTKIDEKHNEWFNELKITSSKTPILIIDTSNQFETNQNEQIEVGKQIKEWININFPQQ